MSDNINSEGIDLGAEQLAAQAEQEQVAEDTLGTPSGEGSGDGKELKPLRLDYKQTFKVGFAFAIIMIFWTAYDFVVPLLLEHAYGLSNAVRGLIMGLDNLLSLFMLPLFGKISDNAKGKLVRKWGRRTPFIVFGTLASVILMVFVPVSTLGQQQKAIDIENGIRAQLNDDTFMSERLEEFWELGGNYCDRAYVQGDFGNIGSSGEGITYEEYLRIRYDANFSSTKAILGMLGAETHTYNGEEVELDDPVAAGISGYDWDNDGVITYGDIKTGNDNYTKYVESGMSTYISETVYREATDTADGHTSLAVYMVILLLVLIAMATFRSPAVALMPDVTPKPLRSPANAVINLCGGIGGAIAFLIYTVVLFGERLENYVIIFASVAAGMLLLLAGYLAFVREKKMVERCHEICKEYGIEDDEEETAAVAISPDESVVDSDEVMVARHSGGNGAEASVAEQPVSDETLEFAKAKTRKLRSPKEWWEAKSKEERARLRSFLLILASIFMWFMGYNSISSNLSIYTTKALGLDAGIASIISGVSMGFSAIAFIPVGYMAAKLGRRKTIMIGLGMAVVAFVLVFACVYPNSNAAIPAALFALFYLIAGFGLIIINVNTLPMVVELSTEATVGQYTGYYYVATMSAQAITPMLAGLVMDHISNRGLFIYGAIFVALAIVFMIFVKHGDSKPVGKGKKLSKEEKRQIRLEAMGDAD